jgi:hypothetical protein
MTQLRLTPPPRALRRRGVRLENIALVPASLLPYRRRYQSIANALPQGAVLLVLPRTSPVQRQLLVQLARGFAARGHQLATRTPEEVRRA